MPIIQPDLERHKVSGVENSPKYNHVYHKGYTIVLFICVIIHRLTRNNSGLIMQTAVHNMQMNINKTKHKPPE